MGQIFENSLLVRLGLAMATITILAFISMVSSVLITEATQGEAAAINQAGTLRMQSYRITTQIALHHAAGSAWDSQSNTLHNLAKEFEQRLTSPRLMNVIANSQEQELQDAYDHIVRQWYAEVIPLLRACCAVTLPKQPAAADSPRPTPVSPTDKPSDWRHYLPVFDAFVGNIHHLVNTLEEDAEANIRLLHLIQIISLFLTIMVVFTAMVMMHTQVLVPLRDLLKCAEQARQGDFSVLTKHCGNDELGRLGRAFNVMAEDLSKRYVDLETGVREKTIHLERSNRSLELLYKTSNRLHELPLSKVTYHRLLKDIEKLAGTGPGTICLKDDSCQRATRLATTRQAGSNKNCQCTQEDRQSCFSADDDGPKTPLCERGNLDIISIPITDQKHQYGVLLMEQPADKPLADWQTRLLEAVADQIGVALNISQRVIQNRRLALLEERSAIARELHDSLAQSLSYMKIQASRLSAALPKDDGEEIPHKIITELRDGINSAYRQLRELLTTFRLQMDGRGLKVALQETVAEFEKRSGIRIDLVDHIVATELSVNEEIHILHIIREALSNVINHSQARQAQVSLDSDDDGFITIVIEDDGIGISRGNDRPHHYGLTIMEERARSLNGKLDIAHGINGNGTRITLTFTSVQHRNKSIMIQSEAAMQ